ncbi:MAG: hypothetical protein E6Q97_37620 [Desulfurellales bacterium]|nr:MAG: hypothetical protein E6Q97_37620 [Desulfurellales bacterium]
MKSITIAPTDTTFLHATHKVVIDYADVAALGSGTTGTIAIIPASGTFPAGTTARFAGMQLVTAFDASDASINSLLVEVGDGGDTDRLLTQTQIAVDGTEILYKVEGAVTQPSSYLVADTIDALFTVAGGASPTLAEITSGELHIYLEITNPQNSMQKVNGPLS